MKYITLDFETYSEAGYEWDTMLQHFVKPAGESSAGLPLVGSAAYAEHPSTEVLCLAYDLHDGTDIKVWKPGDLPPLRLFTHVITGGAIEAWNCSFERQIWEKVCCIKYGFPAMAILQWRDAAAKARAYGLPSSLAKAGETVNATIKKDTQGTRLINKFSIPRTPTKTDKRIRIKLDDDVEDAQNLVNYNIIDVKSETEISAMCPPLSEEELQFWFCDQKINARGVQIDIDAVLIAIELVEQLLKEYTEELKRITDSTVQSVDEIGKLRAWCNAVINASLMRHALSS